MKDIGIITLELNEISRTYFFSNSYKLVIDDAIECRINEINTHQLITKQGEIYVIPYKWLAMKYVPVVKDRKPIK